MKKASALEGAMLIALVFLIWGMRPAPAAQGNGDACRNADLALSQSRLRDALSLFQTCHKQDPARVEALSSLGIVYARLGEFDEAIAAYKQGLALDPWNPQLNMNMGLAYLKSGRYEEAARSFSRTLLVESDNSRVEELRAFCHYQLEQYELAATEAERVHKAAPQDESAAFLLGSIYLKLHFYDKAIPLIDQALRKADSAQTHALLGEAYMGIRAFRKALQEFTRAQELQPDMPGLNSRIGSALVGLGDPERATAEFDKELVRDPNNFEANYYLGRLKRESNNYEAATKYLEKALQLRPGDPSTVREYSALAIQSRDYATAESMLRRVVEKYPNYFDAHVLLAEVYFKTHRPEEAEREKAIMEGLRKKEHARSPRPSDDTLRPILDIP